MARVATAPRRPRVAPYHIARCGLPRSINGEPPGRPRQLRLPRGPVRHRHRRPEQEELGRPDGVHPGWPGWPRPPGDPGLRQTKWSGPNASGGPRVHPGWPGRPRPPGDPGSHQTHHGGHDALIFAARGPGWLERERQTGPTPRPLDKKLGRSVTRPKWPLVQGRRNEFAGGAGVASFPATATSLPQRKSRRWERGAGRKPPPDHFGKPHARLARALAPLS